MQVLNLTHYDLDGVVSSIIIQHCLPPNSMFTAFPTGYGKIEAAIDKVIKANSGGKAHLVCSDMALTIDQCKKLQQHFSNVLFIDHHLSSLDLVKNPEFKFKHHVSDKFCGAALCMDFWKKRGKEFSDSFKDLVKYTNDYDLFSLKFEDSRLLNEHFGLLRFWDFLDKYKNGMALTNDDRLMLRLLIQEKEEKLKNCEHQDIDGKLLYIISYEMINEVTVVFPNFEYYFIMSSPNTASIRTSEKTLENFTEKLKSNSLVESCGGHTHALGVKFKKNLTKGEIIDIVSLFYETMENVS